MRIDDRLNPLPHALHQIIVQVGHKHAFLNSRAEILQTIRQPRPAAIVCYVIAHYVAHFNSLPLLPQPQHGWHRRATTGLDRADASTAGPPPRGDCPDNSAARRACAASISHTARNNAAWRPLAAPIRPRRGPYENPWG